MSYILLPYFKNNPKTDSYFTINTQSSSIYSLVISKYDIFDNSTKFLTELYNTTIFVYNDQNLETFKILSLENIQEISFGKFFAAGPMSEVGHMSLHHNFSFVYIYSL